MNNNLTSLEKVPSIMVERTSFKPYQYPEAFGFWEEQQKCHWLTSALPFDKAKHDYYTKLSPAEQELIRKLLLGFTQAECCIGKYWGQYVSRWFPHSEVQMMGNTFAAWESIHAVAYNKLSDVLGLEDHNVFLEQSEASDKLTYLSGVLDINQETRDVDRIAKTLAIYSGFGEGVSLFSSFGILMNFSRRGLMTEMGTIIIYSIRDESVHSQAGCWLFNKLMEEHYQGKVPQELQDDIYYAASEVVRLEGAFLDMVFSQYDGLMHLSDLKEFIKFRANTKLEEMNLKPLFNFDEAAAKEVSSWFTTESGYGVIDTDFFADKETGYTRGGTDFSGVDFSEL